MMTAAKEVCYMKSLFEQMGGTYTQWGDYLLPDIELPPQEERPIGIWGQRRREFLKSHNRVQYYNLLIKGMLHTHLADINEQAEQMQATLTAQFAKQEGITEQLKADDMMAWVGAMNNISERVREIIYAELICS